MEDLESKFSAACDSVADAVTSGSSAFNDDKIKLKFYGYFKQASDGKCNTTKPGILSFAARSKWNAWNDLGDMSKADAMAAYISLLDQTMPEWYASIQTERKPEDMLSDDSLGTAGSSGHGPGQGGPTKFGQVFSMYQDEEDGDPGGPGAGPMGLAVHPIFDATSLGKTEEVARYLDDGVDVNIRDQDGCSPLHFACDRGHLELIRMLIHRGADMSAQDSDGSSPLHYAAICGHEHVASLLLELGADRSLEDQSGETAQQVGPADWSCWNT